MLSLIDIEKGLTFDDVRQHNEFLSFLGELLNIVARRRVVRYFNNASESVQTRSDGDVESLAEDTIALL